MIDRLEAIRVPPHSSESEQAVLGALMLNENALSKITGIVREEDFYRKDHRLIFRAILDLDTKGQPYDCVTLGEWFEVNGLAEVVGGSNYVLKLANNTASAANVVAYANIVRQKSVLRSAIDIGTELAGDGFEAAGRDPQEILDAAILRLMSLQRIDTQVEFSAKQAAKRAFDELTEAHVNGGAPRAIPTGLTDLDKILGGLHPGDLIVIGARAAMGKTALLSNMAQHAGKSHSVGIVSGEQPVAQIASRMVAASSRVPATQFRTGQFHDEEWVRVTDGFTRLAASRMWFLDRSSPSVAEVARVARKWKQQHGIEALYIDYLQRLEAPGERRWESVGAAVKGLKNLARDLDIPVVVLAQVSRQVETGGKGREPRLGDLADSSEVEKEADQVLMLYREEYYNPDTENKGVAKIIIEKNRHGPTGYVEVSWIGQTMRFENLDRYGNYAA